MRKSWSYWGWFAAIAVAYFASAKLGLSLAYPAEQVTLIWPPTGIALASVLLLGFRVWPAITLAAFLANATANEPLATAAAISVGNTLAAVVGAWLLRRIGFRPSLERFKDVVGLIGLAAIASTTISATIGGLSLTLGGVQPWDRLGVIWMGWWLGDAMGALIVAPPLLTWVSRPALDWPPGRFVEAAVVLIGMVAVGGAVFSTPGTVRYPLSYLVFVLVIWAALRLGQRGTTLATIVALAPAIWGILQATGPFAVGSLGEGLVLLHSFMAAVACTGLLLAAAVSERDAAQRGLRHEIGEYQATQQRLNRVAEALRRSEQRYRSLVLASAQVVWTTTADGRVVEDLPTWREFTGQSAEQMKDWGWMEMLHPDDRERTMEVWAQSLETFSEHVNEFRVKSKDGSYRHVLARAVPVLGNDGEVLEWVGTCTDISEQKEAERERMVLLERERKLRAAADASNRMKDQFLGMLAHELRNPLAAIRYALVLVERGVEPDSGDWARGVVSRQVDYLSRMVDDLLEVSRITRGKIGLEKKRVDCVDVLRQAIEASEPLIREKRHELEVELPQGRVAVLGDTARLEQILVNLLDNAAKYTEANGTIRISAVLVDEHVEVRVIDTGIGIPDDMRTVIFEPFVQAGRASKHAEGGLGIGLTLVKSLAEMHGGTIEALSRGKGEGSEFVLRLPLTDVDEIPEEPETTPQAVPPRRILVVEDNQDSAQTLASLLEMSGHRVELAGDGLAALEAASRFQPDVVLLDIGLPGMDGYEVARRLRQRGEKIKLIAVTGYGQKADRRRSREAGFDHHLVKPVKPREIETLLA